VDRGTRKPRSCDSFLRTPLDASQQRRPAPCPPAASAGSRPRGRSRRPGARRPRRVPGFPRSAAGVGGASATFAGTRLALPNHHAPAPQIAAMPRKATFGMPGIRPSTPAHRLRHRAGAGRRTVCGDLAAHVRSRDMRVTMIATPRSRAAARESAPPGRRRSSAACRYAPRRRTRDRAHGADRDPADHVDQRGSGSPAVASPRTNLLAPSMEP
jgi:hypothetical protein